MYAVASVCEKSLARGPIVNKKKGTAESEKMTLTIWNEIWVCQSSQKESLKMDIMSLMRRSVCKSGWPLRLSASAAITSRAQYDQTDRMRKMRTHRAKANVSQWSSRTRRFCLSVHRIGYVTASKYLWQRASRACSHPTKVV